MNQIIALGIGAGNTRSMLAIWREWGLPEILRKAGDQGIVLLGISAGAICWFEQGFTDVVPGLLLMIDCLGFLPRSKIGKLFSRQLGFAH